MSASIVMDDGQSVIRFYTHDSPETIQAMLKAVKSGITYFAIHIGPLTVKFSNCLEFFTQIRDYPPPPALSSTATSTTSPSNTDQSLYTLIQQQKQTTIISLVFILIFLVLFSFILRKIFQIIRKKTSHRPSSDSKFLLLFHSVALHTVLYI